MNEKIIEKNNDENTKRIFLINIKRKIIIIFSRLKKKEKEKIWKQQTKKESVFKSDSNNVLSTT